MEAPQGTPQQTKWPGRLAIIFLILFAIFWSLGSFFFWTLLSLSAYCWFLQLYTSGSIARSLDGFFSGFRSNTQPPTGNPYQQYRSRTATPSPSVNPQVKARLIIRVVVLGFVFILFFFFLIGLFSRVEDSTSSETVSYTEEPTEDNGTTLWNEKGNAALQNERSDSALYYYDQALAIDPENTYALYNKGLAYVLRQDYRNGNSYARRCLKYHPDYNPAWWLLGYSYDLTSKTDSAVYCLEQAYKQEYYQPEFLQLLAEVYLKKDKRSNALEVYQRIVSLDTTRADAFRKMAELDPSNAEAYMKKVRALEN